MKVLCPSCSNYSFSYMDRMSLIPRRYSMGLHILFFLLIPFVLAFFINFELVDLLIVWFIQFFVLWPFFIIRLQDAALPHYYLPESRLVGYCLYLGVPTLLIVMGFLLAVEFKLGV